MMISQNYYVFIQTYSREYKFEDTHYIIDIVFFFRGYFIGYSAG